MGCVWMNAISNILIIIVTVELEIVVRTTFSVNIALTVSVFVTNIVCITTTTTIHHLHMQMLASALLDTEYWFIGLILIVLTKPFQLDFTLHILF